MSTGEGTARDDEPAEQRPLSAHAGRRQAERDWKQRERRVKQAAREHPWGPDAPYRSVFTNAQGRASLFVAGAGKPQAVIAVLAGLLAVGSLVDLVPASGPKGDPLLWVLTAATLAAIFTILSLSARRRWFLSPAGDLLTAFAAAQFLGMLPLPVILYPLTASRGASVGTALALFVFFLALGAVIATIVTVTVRRRRNGRHVFTG